MANDFVGFLKNNREFQLQKAGENNIPPLPAHYSDLSVKDDLRKVLADRGISQFYSHQARAVELIRQGENVLLMTPTASGKSLVYNVPVLESILDDPGTQALYIFPLKGLEQDQLKALKELSSALGLDNAGEVYDGDTKTAQRKKIRECLPNVIFTNPDMLHLAFIPFHNKWEDFFRRLKYIVVDEIHSYRGVFGSHVAQVFRRLRRICAFYGSAPRFISASATIANPGKHAEALTGFPFAVVDESGAPSAAKHFFFLDPVESPYTLATKLFVNCLENGLRTIVFTKSRKITELIYNWSLNYAPALKEKISPYRAGFLPGERRKIEDRLFSGDLLGVISTSALELGVDIGGLDCCILCGYPGSVSSTWQRAGRVGRKGEESFVFLVAIQDALDHYFMRHPGEFFEKSHEAAVIDPANTNILKKHLVCAAAELPLSSDDAIYDLEKLAPVLDELASGRELLKAKKGDAWISPLRNPQKDVGIRAIGERFMLLNHSGRPIGEMSGGRVFREAFPGAIYLHKGKQYRVEELDLIRKNAVCSEVKANYYTQPLSTGATEVLEEKEKRLCRDIPLHWGMLRITERVISYDKRRSYDNVRISNHPLDLPEHVFETEGLWFIINASLKNAIELRKFDLAGIIHAVEHAIIACMPLFSLCDRGDVGGLSHTCFPLFNKPAIFIYDGHEGGVGLARRAYAIFEELLETTLKVLDECPCTEGCPSCVQDPQCGNRNEPLDKQGARFLLRNWLRNDK